MKRTDMTRSAHVEERTCEKSDFGITHRLSREWNTLRSMPLKARTRNQRADFLTKFPEVEAWYKASCQGSKETGRLRLCNLGNFCTWADLLPNQIANMSEEDLHPILLRFIEYETNRGMVGATIAKRLSAIRAWLRWNGKVIVRPLKVAGAQSHPTLDDKVVCGQHGLREILDQCPTLKIRATVLLIAHAGLRLRVLGEQDGTNGMVLSHLPELDLECLEFTQTPCVINVPRELSKTSRPYLTFLGEEGCAAVSAYLKQRRADGEKLSPTSPLIHTTSARNENRFLTRNGITTPIRKAIRSAGHNMRPYDLRHYFQSRMQIAETRGLVPRAMHRSWMGHVVDMAARYGIARNNIDADLLAESRSAYARCERFLVSLGANDAPQLDQVPPSGMIQEPTTKQKAIPIDEVQEYLTHGWTYVALLPNDQCIVALG